MARLTTRRVTVLAVAGVWLLAATKPTPAFAAAEDEDSRVGKIARRIFPKLREHSRQEVIRGLIQAIREDVLQQPAEEVSERAVLAAEELGVLLADEAVPVLKDAAEVAQELSDRGWAFGRAAGRAIRDIQLSRFPTRHDRLIYALRRILALPQTDPEAMALSDHVELVSSRNGDGVVLAALAEGVRTGAFGPDKRIILLTQQIYWSAGNPRTQSRTSKEEFLERLLELHFDRSPSVQRLAKQYTAFFVAATSYFSEDPYQDRFFRDAVFTLIAADEDKRTEISASWPGVRGRWSELRAVLAECVRMAMPSLQQNLRVHKGGIAKIDEHLVSRARLVGDPQLDKARREKALLEQKAAWCRRMLSRMESVIEQHQAQDGHQ